MIKIKKKQEPAAWTKERQTPGITYETARKDALRQSLLVEQGGICAYCMRRISYQQGQPTDTRIEHLKPRTLSLQQGKPEETLDYNNMILCCNGDIDGNGVYHCDRSKEETCIHFTPFDDAAMKTISYSSKNGKIKSSNTQYNDDINNVLKLNHPRLSENRLAVIKGVAKELGKKTWKKSEVTHKLDFYLNRTSSGIFHEYCGVVIWYLTKKLKLFG